MFAGNIDEDFPNSASPQKFFTFVFFRSFTVCPNGIHLMIIDHYRDLHGILAEEFSSHRNQFGEILLQEGGLRKFTYVEKIEHRKEISKVMLISINSFLILRLK